MCQGFVPSGLRPWPRPSSCLLALQHTQAVQRHSGRGRTAPAGHAAGHPTDPCARASHRRCVAAWQRAGDGEGSGPGRDQDSPGSWLQQGVRHSRHGVPDGLTLQGVVRHVDGAWCWRCSVTEYLGGGTISKLGSFCTGLQSNHVEHKENSKFLTLPYRYSVYTVVSMSASGAKRSVVA